jgi:hypothetical protein
MAMIYVDSVEDARSFYVDRLGFTHVTGARTYKTFLSKDVFSWKWTGFRVS